MQTLGNAYSNSMMQRSGGTIISYHPETRQGGPLKKTTFFFPLASITPPQGANNDETVDPAAWRDLPLTQQLGLDIVFVTHRDTDLFFLKAMQEMGVHRNATLETLTTECDPASSRFGKAAEAFSGPALFKHRHAEGKQALTAGCLDALELFVMQRLDAGRAALAEDGLGAAKAEYAKMTASGLKKFVKDFFAENEARYPGKGWSEMECPVVVAGQHCEGCCVEGGEEGKALLRCGKCRKVAYCSKDCQTGDWKAHKPFCRPA